MTRPSTDSTKLPVTDRGKRTRQKILTAARTAFEEHGYSDTTMSMIATAAGVSHGTAYVYFEDKTSVLRTIVTDLLNQVAVELRAPTAGSLTERIANANERYLLVYTEHARLLRVVEQLATTNEEFAEILQDFRANHIKRVAEVIVRLQDVGASPADVDPMITAAALSAMVEGYSRYGDISNDAVIHQAHKTLTLLWLRALALPSQPKHV